MACHLPVRSLFTLTNTFRLNLRTVCGMQIEAIGVLNLGDEPLIKGIFDYLLMGIWNELDV